MKSTMMSVPLSLNTLFERSGKLFPQSEIVSRLPDKSLRRHTYGQYYQRTRALAATLKKRPCAGTIMRIWSATSASRPLAA
ncbi:MAG: hypothetical protein ACO3BH_05285 [Quisquiliibacterium sp.]